MIRRTAPTGRKPLPILSIGVVLFTAIALASGVAIYSVVTNAALRDEDTFAAEFRNVSGLREGADVQVGGVTVGQVSELSLNDDAVVTVRFTLDKNVPITDTSRAVIRYKDLLGRRILEIRPGHTQGEPLDPGATLPSDQTMPALDLDQLYNGFAPLFDGLDAQQLNDLSSSLIAVMQGQGGNIEQILARTASLTDSLGRRDRLIGALVSNLGWVLNTIESRAPETGRLVLRMQRLMTGLSRDRAALGHSVAAIAGATDDVTRLLVELRPALRDDVRELERLARVVVADERQTDELLHRLPGYYAVLGRVGIYQSAFQFYLCGVQLRFDGVTTSMTRSQEQRCQS